MKTYAHWITVYAVMVTFILAGQLIGHLAEPKSGLPEDRYHYYLSCAQKAHAGAQRFRAEGNNSEAHYSLEVEKRAREMANSCREEYNNQLFIRLSRALAITGDPKMFQEAYDVQKLL